MKSFLAALVATVCLTVSAQTPQPPEIAARSFMLLDVTANQILAAKDIDSALEPASLTKLMTAYLVFDALRSKKIDLKQALSVSERAWKMPGSRMFIDPKMQVPVEDLIKGMIVQSGNDATTALAEGIGGSVENFVDMMNRQAQAFGLRQTAFKNPEGLTAPGHTTTARELLVLAAWRAGDTAAAKRWSENEAEAKCHAHQAKACGALFGRGDVGDVGPGGGEAGRGGGQEGFVKAATI